MKQTIFPLCLMGLLLLAGLTGCELEGSSNGKLDGYWHLEQADSLSGGGVANLREQYYFWSVQGRLLTVDDRSIVQNGYYFSFEHKGDSLILSNPYCNNREEGDPAVEDVSVLRPFGINALSEGFLIEKLSGGKMVLKSNTLRLYFVKF